MKNIFLETDNVLKYRDAMSVVLDYEKGRPGLILVHGRSGRGKSVCTQYHAVQSGAIFLRVLGGMTARDILQDLCFEVNGSRPYSVVKCKRSLVRSLEQEPRTIVVDEADRLRGLDPIEDLRDVHDLTGVPVILVGEESFYARLSARRRLWTRITQSVEFGPLSIEDILRFGMQAADLKVEPKAAQIMARRSDGDFRLIWQDMRDLERMAKANETSAVSSEMVKALPNRKPAPTGGQ